MALTKIEYSTGDTLTAEQVNEIQDAIIKNQEGLDNLTGFGLGGVSTLTTDLNTNNINGWYYYGASATHRPQHIQYGCLLVVNRSGTETEVVQIAFSPLDGTKAQRIYRNRTDGWSEWEYENPPLAVGVEYRTTERFCSKPVYIKRLSCDAMPSANSTKHIVHGISNMEYIVDFGGCMTQDGEGAISLPYYFASENQAHLSVTNENIVIVSGANNLTTYNDTQVWIKYTKTTD